MRSKMVVVGIDGTRSSVTAVRWAAREAVRRDALLRITCAYDRDEGATPAFAGGEPIDVSESIAESATVEAMDEARRTAPTVRIERDPVAGKAARLLIDMSDHADLTVIGAHSHGTLADLLLGSAGMRVATRAESPVVVVRGRSDDNGGPVVAGVDDSPPPIPCCATPSSTPPLLHSSKSPQAESSPVVVLADVAALRPDPSCRSAGVALVVCRHIGELRA